MSALKRIGSPRFAALALALIWGLLGLAFATRALEATGGLGSSRSRLAEAGFAWILSLGDLSVALLLARACLPSKSAARALARLPGSRWRLRIRPHLTYWGGFLGLLALRALALGLGAEPGLHFEAWGDLANSSVGSATIWILAWSAAGAGVPGVVLLWVGLALSLLLPASWQPPLLAPGTPALVWIAIALGAAPLGRRLGPQVDASLRAGRGIPLWSLLRWGSRGVTLLAALVIGLGISRLEAGRAAEPVWVELSTSAGVLRYRAEKAEAALALAEAGPRLQQAIAKALPNPKGEADPPLSLTLEDRVLREGPLGIARRLADARLKRLLGEAASAPPLESFREGAAVHLGVAVSGADPFWYRYQLGVYWARGALTPDCLWDRRVLNEPGHGDLAPALGEAACTVLERRLGPEGLAQVVGGWQREAAARSSWSSAKNCREAWARVLKPLKLTPEDLWEGVVALALEAREDERAKFALPRLRVSIAAEDNPIGWMIYAEPELEVPPGWQLECRVRWQEGEEVLQLQPSGFAGDAQTFFLRSRELRAPPQVQLGITNPSLPGPETTGAIWEDWAEWKLEEE